MSFYKCLIEGVFEQQQKRKPPSGESEKHPLHFIIGSARSACLSFVFNRLPRHLTGNGERSRERRFSVKSPSQIQNKRMTSLSQGV